MFQGSCVALVTPMKESGKVDFEAIKALVAWHIEQGTKAIVALGTTGESVTLTQNERQQVLETVLAVAKGKIPIIAGTGTNATKSTIENTQLAEKLGASGCLVVTPYYNKPTQKGLLAHFEAISKETNLPIILYNVPARTACDLLPETVAVLSEIPNIIGIKEATGDLSRVTALKSHCHKAHGQKEFLLYSGEDANTVDFILKGGHGVISVTANVAPKRMAEVCQLALSGEIEKARALQEKLMPLHQALFCESNPIPVKWALQRLGKIPNGIRLPLTPLSLKYHEVVEAALKQTII